MGDRRRSVAGLAPALFLILLTACDGATSALEPKSEGARHVANLWWVMFWLAAVVLAIVFGALAVAIWRRRPDADEDEDPGRTDRRDRRTIVLGGVVLPLIVLTPVAAVTIRTGQLTRPGYDDALEISVVGNQFWWHVEYPESGVVTANEIHVPVDRPVSLTFTSNDVIHSFWVPEIHGKMDLIPGRETTIEFLVREPGLYLGRCAEYCGLQHTLMRLGVHADTPEEFDAWLAAQSEPAPEPTTEQTVAGRQEVEASCGMCHAIRGTRLGVGTVGPDLTHVASRETLAAGALANTRVNLARWILDAQGVKPGVRMPNFDLDPEELEDVVAYLETLE